MFKALLLFHDYKRRKRKKIFTQNGGLVLKHQRVRIFSKTELAKATDNYNQTNLLGIGGFASVNHKNVVKLLGVCLETKIPLLVYELVPNGTLFQHIHTKKASLSLSSSSAMLRPWKTRLRIATEIALAIDYLHSLAHPPIIHRDIKSTNILLDENYAAKVSDFGASVLIPPGQNGIATTVQGTLGYLDPEYLTTGTLTVKSDVYSFGVVLVELITGEKPTSNGVRTGAKSNIIQYFVSTVRESSGEKYVEKIVDSDVVYDEVLETEQIEAAAELATRCLDGNGVGRPSMKEVADELAGLNKLHGNNYCVAQQIGEETERLMVVDDHDQASSGSRANVQNLVKYATFDESRYDVET
ncbi:Serine/threonine protein kinase [Parasponia andersonii]|uniref:Serine/threonine protein kinase n=1 Tax=Parasponia andersonii TaxID=3476 RepID=A0A2P5A7Y7_PARAD|nr:Serine/threonine protein kinase [Parasponia andersonii]